MNLFSRGLLVATGLLVGLAGCVLPENAGEAKIAAEFGGSPAIGGLYRNDGSVIIDGTTISAHLYTAFGKQPQGEFFKDGDLVRIALEDGGKLTFAWLRGERAISSVSFEREKDFVVESTRVVIKPQRMQGGGLAGSRERQLAVDSEGRLKVLDVQAYGRDVGVGALLSKRNVEIMTFEAVRGTVPVRSSGNPASLRLGRHASEAAAPRNERSDMNESRCSRAIVRLGSFPGPPAQWAVAGARRGCRRVRRSSPIASASPGSAFGRGAGLRRA